MVPSDLSVVIYAAMMRHFISGAYYPRGGSSEIVYQIIPIIERYGGRVLVDAPVSKILIDESGKAHGKNVHEMLDSDEGNAIDSIKEIYIPY